LFPTGVMVSGPNEAAVQITQQLLSDPNTKVIFEATFVYQDYIAKADILIRDDDDNAGWKIIEVKSNVNDDSKLVDDLAYTTFVAQAAGLSLSTCSLLLVNRNYRLGMSDENLFNEVEHTSEVLVRAEEFEEQSDRIAEILLNDEKPDPELRWECKGCDIFEECCGSNIANHIFDLPRLSHTKFSQLRDMDVVCIEDIPADFELTNNQSRTKQAVVTGQPVVDLDGLRQALDSLESPVHYLDFETTQTCIPLYDGIAPYGQIPTQYSLHIQTAQALEHREYLATDPQQNCTRQLAESLIGDCISEGSIVVYTMFEKTVINGLTSTYPDLGDELRGLAGRLVDLCAILRAYYYHPGFHGSYSIKKVLPVVVVDMGYDGMAVDSGSDASALFAYLARGEYEGQEAEVVRKNLLEYCGLDTMAMVRLVEEMKKVVGLE